MVKTIKYLLILLSFFLSAANDLLATTYYSRASGNWNASSTWSTTDYGDLTNSGTYPQIGDNVFVGDGYTVTISANAFCASLTIGEGSSGIVTFSTSGARTLTMTGDLTINNSGKFWYNGNAGRVHTLSIGGSISNTAGTIDFYYDANDLVNITFTGSNAIVAGEGVFDLYNITESKTDVSSILDIQSTTFETAIRNTLNLITGTYIHNNSSTFEYNPNLNSTISGNACIKIPSGAMNFATNANYLYLQGSLYINGGSCIVGKPAGGNTGIASDQNGTSIPYLEVTAGNLEVRGSITCKSTATAEPFQFKMTGGRIVVQTGRDPSVYESFKVTNVANSFFEMDGGIIEIQQANVSSSYSLSDFDICGTNGTVYSTGGIVQFGNSNTDEDDEKFSFTPYSGVISPHFRVSNGELYPSAGSGNTANYQLLSLQIDNHCKFDNRSIIGIAGDNKHMSIRGSINNNAFINNGDFEERLGEVIFQDDTLQRIGGSSVTQFQDFTINNTADVTLDTSILINGQLTLTIGLINTTASDLLTTGNNANVPIGSSTSYVSGPMKRNIATNGTTSLNFPIGADGFYRPALINVKHSSAGQAYYWGRVVNSPASALTYALPATLSSVSIMRYWQFVRTGFKNFSNGYAKLYYGNDDGVTDPDNLRVGQGVGANWVDEGGTGTSPYVGTITSNTFTTFAGIFALANSTGGSNPLPIQIISFDAKWTKAGNLLLWSTSSEINNDYFEVQRSYNGTEFEDIHRQAGAGNVTQVNQYSYLDESPAKKLVYYRLVQVDYDGQFSYSEIKTVNGINSTVNLFPTSSNGENVFVSLSGIEREKVSVRILNDQGQQFSEQKSFSKTPSSVMRLENIDCLTSGKYYAVIETADAKKVITFFIEK